MLLLFAALAFAAPKPLKTFQLPPAKRERAVELHRRFNILHFAAIGWDLLVLAAATRLPRRRSVPYVAILLTVMWAAGLPFAIYRHKLAVDYGLSIQTWGPWLIDVLKSSLISGAIAVLLVLAMLELARRSPRRWWIWSWGVVVLFMIAGTYLAPLVLDPLFFKFERLDASNPALVSALQKVASEAGYSIDKNRIFDMKASEKTRLVNAYMTGFGNSRRIVIWDTTLKALTTPQIQTVFAHEMGHYKLNHIGQGIVMGAMGLFAGFWLWNLILQRLIVSKGRFGVRNLHDPAIVPVAAILALSAAFISEPIVNSISRWVEHQADIFELEAMHGLVEDAGGTSADVDQIMGEIDLDNPDPSPLEVFWLFDHPPTDERMRFAQTYDPWKSGERPRYIRN